MEVLQFEEGLKEFSINGDESRVIRFNPADSSILTRVHDVQAFFETEKKKIEEKENDAITPDEICDYLNDLDKLLRDKTNYIFGYKVDEIVYQSQSAVSLVRGKFLFQNFIESIIPLLTSSYEDELAKSQKNIDKYTENVERFD